MKKPAFPWSLLLRFLATALILILVYFYNRNEWPHQMAIIRRSNPVWLLAAFLCYGITTALGIWRWHVLLKACHAKMKLSRTIQLTFMGLFANQFMPGAMGGDVVKAIYTSREIPHIKPTVIMSIVMERLLGFVAMFLVSTALILSRYEQLTRDPITRFAVHLYLGVFLIVIVVLAVGAWNRAGDFLPFWKKLPFREGLREAGQAYQLFLRHPSCFWGGLVLSALAHFSLMLTFYFVSIALQMDLNFIDLAAVLPLIAVVTLIPVTINGFGLREVAFQHFLSFAAMTKSSCVALSLGGTFLILIWSLVGGPIYLRYGRKPRNP
ncbi:MAG: lysylphosphatidylglycerol synthase transmembrane domain-containing protein [Methylacidiphilales bacterium]|nr:lysylphosphatidylglycerol synthase transmembrane domain-containing protein [Candidatus Methylacidiphilales bacterium]